MTNFSKQAHQIKKEIVSAKNILLHLHPGPDGDSVGSVLATYHALKQLGKKVSIISGDSPPPDFLSHLPGFKHIKFQNFFQTELEYFDLFIILDSADLKFISDQGTVVFPPHLKTINIDHHSTNPSYANLNLIDPNSPATCQILYALFIKWDIAIDQKIAACLLTGLYTDTAFKYDYTNWQTFDIAAKLAKFYPRFPALFSKVDNSNTAQTIKLAGLLLSSVHSYLNNHLAIASVSASELKQNKLSKSDSKGLDATNLLKSVSAWYIAVTLFEIQPKLVKASFRTNLPHKYNLAKIAAAVGDGGGHPAAAGSTLKLSLSQAQKVIINTVSRLYPQIEKS